MKKVLYILTAAAALLWSCTSELEEMRPNVSGERVAPEGYALVNFSVDLPKELVQTKVFSDDPVINNLRVAVFDENYYLEDYVLATSKGPVDSPVDNSHPNVNYDSENQGTTTWNYQVTLPTSDEYRIIHFIANGPDDLGFGTEVEVIGNLFVTGKQDAYWQRVELEDGIVADGTGNLKSTTASQLSGIQLIRNFAKISITSSPKATSNFELEYAYVMNDASAGTIAPYCPSTRDFIQNYQNYNSDELWATFNYEAWMPTEYTLNTNVPSDAGTVDGEWKTPGSNGYAETFIYERETPQDNPVIVLIYGKYYADVENHPDSYIECYYKVDLKNTEDAYFPVHRNFNYKINIRKVSTPGRTTVQEAIDMPGSGNVSTAVENEELTNISDGVSRIAVSFTDTTVVSGNAFELKYKFIPDFQNAPTTYDNVRVLDPEEAANATGKRITITTTPDDGGSGMFTFTVDDSHTDAEGYSTITIDPVEPGSITRTQKLQIKGIAIDGTAISRDITVVLRQKGQLQLYCQPSEIQDKEGSEVDVVLQIPGGLSKMIFPLEIKIESADMSIVPAKGDNLPVESGQSIILANPSTPGDETTTGKPAFYFIKTVTWADYNAAALESDATKHIVCHFKSNTNDSETTIWAANRYFYTGYTTLGNYTPKNFQSLTFTGTPSFTAGGKVGASFDFASTQDFTSLDGGPVTVTLVGLEPAEDDTALTPIQPSADIPGGYEYSYIPTNRTGNALNLASLAATGPWQVYLDAPKFNRKELRRTRQITINGQVMTFTNATNSNVFGSAFSTDISNTRVYIRENEYDEDMSATPYALVRRTTGGNWYNTTYSFSNTNTTTTFNVDVTTDRLYFLYDYNGTIYSGSIAITPGTSNLTINNSSPSAQKTVTFTARKDQGVLDIEDLEVRVGDNATVNVIQNTNAGATITYTSSDPTIATITNGGVVTGVKAGVTTITASVAATGTHGAAETIFTVTVTRPAIYVTVNDTVTETTISGLTMTNMGTQKAYIRAAIVAAWYDNYGNVVAPWTPSQGTFAGFPGSGWDEEGDFYYYETALNVNGTPGAPLFTSYTKPVTPPVAGSHLELTVTVQAIPYDSGKTCMEAFAALI